MEGDGERWETSESRVVNRVEIDPDTEIRLVRANAIRMMAEDDKDEASTQESEEGKERIRNVNAAVIFCYTSRLRGP